LADTEAKLSKTRSEMEEKKAKFEGFAEELTRSKEKHLAVGKRVQTMMNQVDPERVALLLLLFFSAFRCCFFSLPLLGPSRIC